MPEGILKKKRILLIELEIIGCASINKTKFYSEQLQQQSFS